MDGTDEDLILHVGAGRVEALGPLVARWEQPLFRFVYRIVGRSEDARDVCQETFLRILDRATDFRHGARFSTWMYQIALNLCRDRARHQRRWSHRFVTSGGEFDAAASARAGTPSPDDAASGVEVQEAVRRALAGLPDEQREVVVLKEYEGLKFREIAEVLGAPESTVKSRLYAALDAMRESLARQGFR